MKNNQLEQFKKDGEGIHLTSSEKNTVRGRLHAYMQHNPVQEKRGHVSPFWMFSRAFHRHVVAYALVIGLAVVSASTVYAAQQSLPGELLYVLKTDVVEPTSEFFVVSDRARTTLLTSHLQNRLEESVEILDEPNAESRLSIAGQKLIDTTDRARKHISESDDLSVEEKIEAQKNFLSFIEAHQEIVDETGSSELTAIVEQNQNIFEESLSETIESYTKTASSEDVHDHFEDTIDDIEKKLDTNITNEQRNILTEGINESLVYLSEENVNDALRTLILHDQDAEVIGIIAEITATITETEGGTVRGEVFDLSTSPFDAVE